MMFKSTREVGSLVAELMRSELVNDVAPDASLIDACQEAFAACGGDATVEMVVIHEDRPRDEDAVG